MKVFKNLNLRFSLVKKKIGLSLNTSVSLILGKKPASYIKNVDFLKEFNEINKLFYLEIEKIHPDVLRINVLIREYLNHTNLRSNPFNIFRIFHSENKLAKFFDYEKDNPKKVNFLLYIILSFNLNRVNKKNLRLSRSINKFLSSNLTSFSNKNLIILMMNMNLVNLINIDNKFKIIQNFKTKIKNLDQVSYSNNITQLCYINTILYNKELSNLIFENFKKKKTSTYELVTTMCFLVNSCENRKKIIKDYFLQELMLRFHSKQYQKDINDNIPLIMDKLVNSLILLRKSKYMKNIFLNYLGRHENNLIYDLIGLFLDKQYDEAIEQLESKREIIDETFVRLYSNHFSFIFLYLIKASYHSDELYKKIRKSSYIGILEEEILWKVKFSRLKMKSVIEYLDLLETITKLEELSKHYEYSNLKIVIFLKIIQFIDLEAKRVKSHTLQNIYYSKRKFNKILNKLYREIILKSNSGRYEFLKYEFVRRCKRDIFPYLGNEYFHKIEEIKRYVDEYE